MINLIDTYLQGAHYEHHRGLEKEANSTLRRLTTENLYQFVLGKPETNFYETEVICDLCNRHYRTSVGINPNENDARPYGWFTPQSTP